MDTVREPATTPLKLDKIDMRAFVETGSRAKFIYTHEDFEKSEEVGMKPEIDEKNPPPPMNHL